MPTAHSATGASQRQMPKRGLERGAPGVIGGLQKMILREYLEILDKHDMWCSHLPNDSQLAKMTESSLEKQCLDIEKIFDEVFNEKHTERLNSESDSKEIL